MKRDRHAHGRRGRPGPAAARRVQATVLGFFLIFFGLTDARRAAAARRHVEGSLSEAVDREPGRDAHEQPARPATGDLMAAILTNASLAAMHVADGSGDSGVAPLLEELEESTRRATALYTRILSFDA